MGSGTHAKTQSKGVLLLLLTAFIWGTAFIAQSKGMDLVDAFTFSGVRTVLAALALMIAWLFRRAIGKTALDGQGNIPDRRKTLVYGTILGVAYFFCSNFQQFAFYYTTAGKIAFITTLYVFFVPLISLFLGKKIPPAMWICVAAGFVALYFLCIKPGEDFSINRGDLLTVVCALLFAVHILLIERYSPVTDGIELSCIQFTVAGALSVIMMFIFENPSLPAIIGARYSLLYAGVLSGAVAYTLQIVGQKYTEATLASLLMCMESVFAVIASALILHERMSGREIFGCVLMFVSVVAANHTSCPAWE